MESGKWKVWGIGMTYTFDCYYSRYQRGALLEFNCAREELEEMHGCKIKVIKMYKKLLGNYVVEYELTED